MGASFAARSDADFFKLSRAARLERKSSADNSGGESASSVVARDWSVLRAGGAGCNDAGSCSNRHGESTGAHCDGDSAPKSAPSRRGAAQAAPAARVQVASAEPMGAET